MRLTVLKNHVPTSDVLVDTPDLTERYEIYVGRSEDCHVQIDDPLISRHHFVLKNENGKWICEKLSQLGVVSINGISANEMSFQEGDEIKCGTYSVIVSEIPRLAPEPTPVQVFSPSYEPAEPIYYQEPKVSQPAPVAQPVPDSSLEMMAIDEMEDSSSPAEELEMTGVMSSDKDSDRSLDLEDLDKSIEFDTDENFNQPEESQPEQTTNIDTFSESNSEFGGMGGDVVEHDSDEKTSFFKAFVNYQLVLFGDHAPYDRYQIDSSEIYIGRDPKKCQIVLDDPEVSTVHAVLKKNNIEITLEDLNSSNGTILNGERINRAHLTTGDEFVIGSTSFSLETRSDLLEAESGRLMPVEHGQIIETEEIEEELVDADEMGDMDFGSDVVQDKSLVGRFKNDKTFRTRVLGGLAVCAMIWAFWDDIIKKEPEPKATAKTETVDKNAKPAVQLSEDSIAKRNTAYELGYSFYDQLRYSEALKEFETVIQIDPNYKTVQSLYNLTKDKLKNLEALDAQKRAELEKIKNKQLIEEILVKAREAVKERQATLAESYFAQIVEKDPENMEVQQLKLELEAWQKEQERIALEKASQEAARKSMVDALSPGKTFYLKKEWYRAILKLEEFLRRKGIDEDLVKEGSDMLADSKNQLASELGPLVGKARSLKEGQDLKSAYEAFLDILKVEPTNAEALNEVDDIRNQLESRSKKIYREAIIAESLSLFSDAKEKFQEVQQISPSDSEYFRKASDKLKNYLE